MVVKQPYEALTWPTASPQAQREIERRHHTLQILIPLEY